MQQNHFLKNVCELHNSPFIKLWRSPWLKCCCSAILEPRDLKWRSLQGSLQSLCSIVLCWLCMHLNLCVPVKVKGVCVLMFGGGTSLFAHEADGCLCCREGLTLTVKISKTRHTVDLTQKSSFKRSYFVIPFISQGVCDDVTADIFRLSLVTDMCYCAVRLSDAMNVTLRDGCRNTVLFLVSPPDGRSRQESQSQTVPVKVEHCRWLALFEIPRKGI